MNERRPIHPVVLVGGSGSRLWPLSRAAYPKQFLRLFGENSLLQDTMLRVCTPNAEPATIICNAEHRFLVAEQLRAIEAPLGRTILEPIARSTAPAVAVAALMARERDDDAILLVLPSDHLISDVGAFHEAMDAAAKVARDGYLMTFGMSATAPLTGFGYIHRGTPMAEHAGAFHVDRFVEKPDRASAEKMLADGGYDWNSGMFVFAAATFLDELERHHPEIVSACAEAIRNGTEDMDFFRLEEEAFARNPSVSIDVAVIEKTEKAAVVPANLGWSDVGTWPSLWELGERNDDDNVVAGDVIAREVEHSYLRSDGPLLAAIGLKDVIIVATEDAVLAAPKNRAHDVGLLVQQLKSDSRVEHHSHPRVYRPWGWYQGVDKDVGFKVKRICVNPGARLSLQYHHHRVEHWIVVSGRARVTRGDKVFDLGPNESTYINFRELHRLENPGTEPLQLIEVQSGDYLEEDDIVRVEDDYKRT